MDHAAKKEPLKDIASIRAGYDFRGKILETPGSGIGVIQLRNCSLERGVDWQEIVETTVIEKSKTPWLTNGDILFAARGGRYYALTVRQPATAQFAALLAAPHFYILRLNNDSIPEFVTWQLNALPCRQYFESVAVGSAMKSIRRDALSKTPLYIPSIETQSQILNVVNAIYRERQLIETIAASGKQLLDGMAQELSTHHVTHAGDEIIPKENH